MDDPAVEFAAWDTPISGDDLFLIDISFNQGDWWGEIPSRGIRFEVPARYPEIAQGLQICLVSVEKRALYQISARDVEAFRMLGEHGLTELWQATADQGSRPAKSTFRVRNHGWSRESFLSFEFALDRYSFMIVTDTECVEIVTHEEPVVSCLRAVEALPLTAE